MVCRNQNQYMVCSDHFRHLTNGLQKPKSICGLSRPFPPPYKWSAETKINIWFAQTISATSQMVCRNQNQYVDCPDHFRHLINGLQKPKSICGLSRPFLPPHKWSAETKINMWIVQTISATS